MARNDRKGTPRAIVRWLERIADSRKAGQWGDIQDTDLRIAVVPDGLSEGEECGQWAWETATRHPDAFAESVLDVVQDDTNSRGTTTTYLLKCFLDGRVMQSYRIRRNPEEEDPWANPSGSAAEMVGQSLKHNEVLMRSFIQATHTVLAQQGEVVTMLSKRLEVMEETQRTAFEMMRDAIQLSAEAESRHVADEHREQRTDRIVEKLTNVAEVFLAKQLAPPTKPRLQPVGEGNNNGA